MSVAACLLDVFHAVVTDVEEQEQRDRHYGRMCFTKAVRCLTVFPSQDHSVPNNHICSVERDLTMVLDFLLALGVYMMKNHYSLQN